MICFVFFLILFFFLHTSFLFSHFSANFGPRLIPLCNIKNFTRFLFVFLFVFFQFPFHRLPLLRHFHSPLLELQPPFSLSSFASEQVRGGHTTRAKLPSTTTVYDPRRRPYLTSGLPLGANMLLKFLSAISRGKFIAPTFV